ncbi:hypothetical protein FRB90_004191 [Tulasnella sp. 427]|nr:hypothetical protein FRB90_004191 [Tulasnella sp. 427]
MIHDIRSQYDFSRYHLPPLRTSPPPVLSLSQASARRRRPAPQIRWGRSGGRNTQEQDDFDRAVERRKWVYRHRLYAKHIASNQYTRFKPYPTPQQFAASQDLISRTTAFIRRELQVWTNLDVEFLTSFILALMKSIDIRAESAVKLLSEFLDIDATESGRRPNAEHFAHELYTYLRSPYRDLAVYDSVIQVNTHADTRRNLNLSMTSRRMYLHHLPNGNATIAGLVSHDRRDHRPAFLAPENMIEGMRLITARDATGGRNQMTMTVWNGHLAISTVPEIDHLHPLLVGATQGLVEATNTETGVVTGVEMTAAETDTTLRRVRRDRKEIGRETPTEIVARNYRTEFKARQGLRQCAVVGVGVGLLILIPMDSTAVASSSRRRSDRSQSAAYKVEEDDQIPDAYPTIKESGGTVIGLSIKGQAAKLGLIKTRLADDDEMVDASDRVQALHSITLPRLLARMTDSKRTIEKASGAEEVAPSVADIMARTRHQLSLKRKGKGKAVNSDADADEDLDLSYPEPGVPNNDLSYLDAERRKQLMAKLAEERKKFVQPEASPQTELGPELQTPSKPNEESKSASLDAQESRLRAQARLRVKLAAEKRKVSGAVPLQSPSTSTPISTILTPTGVPPTPILPSPTTGPLLSLEDGLKAKLKQRQAVANKEQDLKEALMKRKQSLS